jgi:low temperature requirement protein LtrA
VSLIKDIDLALNLCHYNKRNNEQGNKEMNTDIPAWMFLSGIGYIIGHFFNQGVSCALIGLVIAIGISFFDE